MYLSYQNYTDLGHSVLTEQDFPRYEAMARKTVDRYCFDRVNEDNITSDNKLGMCEMIDIYYLDKNPQSDNENKIVSSFSNEGYSETYVTAKQASADTIKTTEQVIFEVIGLYFTRKQLYRGI